MAQTFTNPVREALHRVDLMNALRGVLICALLGSSIITSVLAVVAGDPATALIMWPILAVVLLLAYMLLGLPVHILLAVLRMRRALHYLGTGAACGVLLKAFWLTIFWDAPRAEINKSAMGLALPLALFVIYGASASLAFWYFAVRRRAMSAPSN